MAVAVDLTAPLPRDLEVDFCLKGVFRSGGNPHTEELLREERNEAVAHEAANGLLVRVPEGANKPA
jgi:hypothetical protein